MNLVNVFRKLLAPPVFADEESTRVAGVLNLILRGFVIVGLGLALGAGLTSIRQTATLPLFIGTAVVFFLVGVGGLLLVHRGLLRPVSLTLVVAVMLVITVIIVFSNGVRSPALPGYLIAIILASLLLGGRAAAFTALFSWLAVAGLYFTPQLQQLGLTSIPDLQLGLDQNVPYTGDLVLAAAVYSLAAIFLYLSSRSIRGALSEARENARAQAEASRSLQASRATLEARSRDLELAVAVGQRLASVRNVDELLHEAVELIRARFDLTYCQIYLTTATGRALALRAGTGPVGAELLRRRHRLPIGSGSINGTAAADKRPVIVADTSTSSLFRPNPLLPGIRSEMSMPLLVGADVLGVLNLQSTRIGALSADTLPIFEAIAGQLAIALENARLFAEAEESRQTIEKQARRLTRTAWQDFMDAVERHEQLGYTFDQQTIAPLETPLPPPGEQTLAVPVVVGGEMVGQLQIDSSPGQTWEDDDTDFVFSVVQQVGQQVENLRLLHETRRYQAEAEMAALQLVRQAWQTHLTMQPTTGYTYTQKQVQPITDPAALPPPTLTQPLAVRGQKIGVLEITQPEGLPPEALEILTAVSEKLSTHLDNLRLLEETEHNRQMLDKRATELEAVAQVSTAASTILVKPKLLQTVVDMAKRSFGLYHAHVYLLDEMGDNLVLTAGAGEVGRQMTARGWKIPFDREQSLVARAARERRGVIINDVRVTPDFLPNPLLPNTRAEMAVPLIVGDRLLGVFDVQADTVGHFTEDDVNIHTTLASQIGVALQNAELYSEQLATVTRLRELDHLKSSFMANMSHELRTPLNSILGFADVILEELDGPLSPRMQNDMTIIKKNGQHLLNLINDVLDMAKIESGKMTLNIENFNLRELLEEVSTLMRALADDKRLKLHLTAQLPPEFEVAADRIRLRQVLINLIGNAIKFTDRGSITLHTRQTDRRLFIDIIDTGVGIPPEKLGSAFERFQQVDTSTTRKAGGTGLGLPISQQLIELHGGRLSATSTGVPGEGATFTIELPLEALVEAHQ